MGGAGKKSTPPGLSSQAFRFLPVSLLSNFTRKAGGSFFQAGDPIQRMSACASPHPLSSILFPPGKSSGRGIRGRKRRSGTPSSRTEKFRDSLTGVCTAEEVPAGEGGIQGERKRFDNNKIIKKRIGEKAGRIERQTLSTTISGSISSRRIR